MERLTGQTKAGDVNVELQIMMPLQTLLDPTSDKTAVIPGYGPLPTELARDILITPTAASGGADSSPHPAG